MQTSYATTPTRHSSTSVSNHESQFTSREFRLILIDSLGFLALAALWLCFFLLL